MSDQTANAAPAGWYPDPGGRQQQRWWDGTQWTAHFQPFPAPVPAPATATVETMRPRTAGTAERNAAEHAAGASTSKLAGKVGGPYWLNILSFRAWGLMVGGGVVIGGFGGLLLPVIAAPLAFIGLAIGAWVALQTQLYCRWCQRRLTSSGTHGDPRICPYCQRPTDAGIRAGAK